jgi:outer membrane protein assembly factor BamE (lipoprotein component of BamABCDE complex)
MDRDQVLLALGRPVRKVRETTDGEETEDWIYGNPPGKIVFVTFKDNKVIKVKEAYAGLGTEAKQVESPR